MFDAWYNKITNNPECDFDLAMTDTDSFLFKVSNVKEFYKHFKQYMDFSNYDLSNPLFNEKNKTQLGFFKDEFCGKLKCLEFVGLRSKCYAMNLKNIEEKNITEKKVCKGLGKQAIKNRLKFNQYKDCLFKNKIQRHHYYSIRSTKHNVKTVLINKKALSFFDTKRWLFDCAIHSVPYGSYLIKKFKNKCPRCSKPFKM